jgi:hypothetical protein
VCESKGILDSGSVSVANGCEATSGTFISLNWYEMTQLDAQECEKTPNVMVRRNRSSAQDPMQVAGNIFGSKGATTSVDGVIGLETYQVEVPEVLPQLRGSVEFCSSKGLLRVLGVLACG